MEEYARFIELSELLAVSKNERSSIHYDRMSNELRNLIMYVVAPEKLFGQKNPVSRKQVQDGQVTIGKRKFRLKPEAIQKCLELSDILDIDEIKAVELMSSANSTDELSRTDTEIAISLYFKTRNSLFNCILLLFESPTDIANVDIRHLVTSVTNDLLSKNDLPMKLLKQVKVLSQAIQSSNTDRRVINMRKSERKLIVEILFIIFYFSAAAAETTLALLEHLQELSGLLSQPNQNIPQVSSANNNPNNQLWKPPQIPSADKTQNPVDQTGNLRIAVILEIILITILDPQQPVLNPLTGEQVLSNPLLEDSKFIAAFHNKVTGTWPNDRLKGILLFSWAHFLKSYKPQEREFEKLITTVVKGKTFSAFQEVIDNEDFRRETYFPNYVVVINNLISNFLQYSTVWDQQGTELVFPEFLQFLASLYKDQPDLAITFWDRQSHLYDFVQLGSEKIDRAYTNPPLYESLFLSYLGFLTSLASGSEAAQETFEFVRSSPRRCVKWNEYFDEMKKVIRDFDEKKESTEWAPGLEAILKLMQEVVRNNEFSRMNMQMNSDWKPLEICFALLTCPVVATLKANLCLAIAAFAKSPELTIKIWQLLEGSQILQTYRDPSSRGQPEGGIVFELENEAKNQRYPLSTAFLILIEELLNHPVPMTLGGSYREPGISPYLSFVENNVFRRLDERNYEIPASKLKHALHALRIFFKILDQYDMPPEDFEDHFIRGKTVAPKSPGFEMMKHFLSPDSDILKHILKSFRVGMKHIEVSPEPDAETPLLEEVLILSLKIIHTILNKQALFVERLSQNVVTPIDQQLLRDTEIITTIARAVCLDNAELALYSVKIIDQLSWSIDALVMIFQRSGWDEQIRSGYLERLKTDEPIFVTAEEGEDALEMQEGQLLAVQKSVRVAIMNLLVNNLRAPAPNLVHFLCGFRLDGPLAKSDLSVRRAQNCLTHILSFLARQNATHQYPELSELCFQFVYRLATTRSATTPTMAFLRSERFFVKQLELFPVRYGSTQNSVHHLKQKAWLLKAIALELHIGNSAVNKNVLDLLFSSDSRGAQPLLGYDLDVDDPVWEQRRKKILELLDSVDFRVSQAPSIPRHLHDFEIKLENFAMRDPRTLLIDVPLLKRALFEEKKRLERQADFRVPANRHVAEQIKGILAEAVNFNEYSQLLGAHILVFESWKQIIEVVISDCYEYLRHSTFLYELLEILLKKHSEEIKPELAPLLASVVMMILAKLREQKLPTENGPASSPDLPIDQLHTILAGIIDGIVESGSSQVTRGYFYAALLNYLKLCSSHTRHSQQALLGSAFEYDKKTQMLQLGEAQTQQALLDGKNYQILSKKAILIKTIAQDTCNSTDVWKSMAFSVLDVLLEYDQQFKWLDFLSLNGYLKHWLSDLQTQQGGILDLLTPSPETLRPLYVFESKMSLLCRISQTPQGATLLEKADILIYLEKCTFIDQRPEDVIFESQSWLPSVMQRYEQLLLPVLRLVAGVLNSLTKNEDVARQVLDFIGAHAELFSTILKDRSTVTPNSVNALILVTEIFYHLAHFEELFLAKLQGRAGKFQNLLINLLAKYCVPERWKSRVPDEFLEQATETSPRGEVGGLVAKLCQNLVAYTRLITASSFSIGSRSQFPSRILFAPKLTVFFPEMAITGPEFGAKSEINAKDIPLALSSTRAPSLAILVYYLRLCATDYFELSEKKKTVQSQLGSRLSVQELTKKAAVFKKSAELSPTDKERLAQLALSEELAQISRQMRSLIYVLENALFIVHYHLEHFFHVTSSISYEEQEELRNEAKASLAQSTQGKSIFALLEEIESKETSLLIFSTLKKLKHLISKKDTFTKWD